MFFITITRLIPLLVEGIIHPVVVLQHWHGLTGIFPKSSSTDIYQYITYLISLDTNISNRSPTNTTTYYQKRLSTFTE